MKPNEEQLLMLSYHELNCAVAEKKGLPLLEQYGKCVAANIDTKKCSPDQIGMIDYINNPNDYMQIAIEHEITIDFMADDGTVCAVGVSLDEYVSSGDMPKAQTGRAVCIAFLLMEIDK